MNAKILVEVLLPATGCEYEFRIPQTITVEQAADMIARLLSNKEPAVYRYTGGADLMRRDGNPAGQLLQPNELIGTLVARGELVDGSPLALV